jgi:hypothetical protein
MNFLLHGSHPITTERQKWLEISGWLLSLLSLVNPLEKINSKKISPDNLPYRIEGMYKLGRKKKSPIVKTVKRTNIESAINTVSI